MELLTQTEVAAILRCSPEKVRRLRTSGKLAFIPGRPPLIERRDLDDYQEREAKRQAVLARRRLRLKPEPGTPEHDQMIRDFARQRWIVHRVRAAMRRA